MHVYWHRRDLRLQDNRGLTAAASDGPVVPVYVLDSAVLDRLGDRQRAFVLAGVRALRSAYRSRGSDLLVREGRPVDVLSEVLDAIDAERVWFADHYSPVRRTRQRRVADKLPASRSTDLVVVDPDTLDDRYRSHNQFRADWDGRPHPDPVPTPDSADLVADELVTDETDRFDDESIPTMDADVDLPPAGYEAARERWETFLDDGIERYADSRDDMSAAVERPIGSVSRLSTYLAAGMIGVRELWADATERLDRATDSDVRRNVEKYRDELTWRERYYHLLTRQPSVATDTYVDFESRIEWRNDPEAVRAWKAGETGYPLVDAGMRQLSSEGYVHNRPRQNVASFLTKHLLVDWRVGERHFREQLVDYDPASNPGNWQWVASTGTDTVDVRIFDPVAQMAKYDPAAEFVTEYVSELRGVDPDVIVEWPTLTGAERDRHAAEYPHPIVDRDAAYERAQRTFERALGRDE